MMMDWDVVEDNWDGFRGRVQERWSKLTSEDLDAIRGRYDHLVGKIQQRYVDDEELTREEVRESVDEWLAGLERAEAGYRDRT